MGALARRTGAAAAVAALAAGTLGIAGCGGSGTHDLANGKAKFAACAGCHTLADAGSKGDPVTGGPNLDDAFRAARIQGFKQSSFEGLVKYWVQDAEQRTAPIMPRNLVKGKDLDDVAAYIATVAGKGTTESPARPQEPIQ